MQVRSWKQVGSSTKLLRLLLLLLLPARLTLPAAPAPALGAPPATTKSADGDAESATRAAYIPPWPEMRTLIESSLDAGPRFSGRWRGTCGSRRAADDGDQGCQVSDALVGKRRAINGPTSPMARGTDVVRRYR
jgi:hypothetical protein